jgi:hypothetical protein
MGLGSLNGRPFRIDPNTISWPYNVKSSVTPTLGGKVVQIFGSHVGDMTVGGEFGGDHSTTSGQVGGYADQVAFLNAVTSVADFDVAIKSYIPQVRFVYPPRNWDFMVNVKDYTQTGESTSIVSDSTTFNPKWTLTLFIAQNNLNLIKVASDAVLARLATGLGWSINQFNGPGTLNEFLSAENATSPANFFNTQFPGVNTSGGSNP